MYYFDCLCEAGPRNYKDPAAPWSVQDVLRWMDHCGIAGALVTHTLAASCDPVSARGRLRAELAAAPDRLFPVWSALPPHAGDAERTPADLLRAMDDAGVRAVKLYPKTHGYPLVEAVMGPLLDALSRRCILTLLDVSEIGAGPQEVFERLDALLAAHPDLPVLLQQCYWNQQRVVLPLMERHANLHIEFSHYQVMHGPEEYVRRFGADRLLFGTGLPAMSAGAARAYVDYAQITPGDRAKIAGGNLTRLLGGLKPRPAPRRAADALCAAAAAGRPLRAVPVLDAHCHLLPPGRDAAGGYVMHGGDARGILEVMDWVGIRTTALMSWEGPVCSDVVHGNTHVADAVARWPKRFFGVAYVNPTHTAPGEELRALRRLVEKKGFRGLKPYHQTGLRYDDPLYDPFWTYANDRGLYALTHLRNDVSGGVPVMEKLAQKYPRMQWVVPHTGSTWKLAREMAAAMKTTPNLWAELTYTSVTNGLIEWMAAEVGDDRILFGTDAPMRDPRPQFGWVVWADLPAPSRRRILGGNFARLLARGGAPARSKRRS